MPQLLFSAGMVNAHYPLSVCLAFGGGVSKHYCLISCQKLAITAHQTTSLSTLPSSFHHRCAKNLTFRPPYYTHPLIQSETSCAGNKYPDGPCSQQGVINQGKLREKQGNFSVEFLFDVITICYKGQHCYSKRTNVERRGVSPIE